MSDLHAKQTAGEGATECNPTAWWDDRPLPLKILMGTGMGILLVAALILFGFVTMWLWNWLMPDIFGLKAIDYWQAWGLILLSAIFFKRIGSGNSGNNRSTDRKRKRELRKYLREAAVADKPETAGGGNGADKGEGAAL